MALTPTYSWPLPDNTDLVKDGAEAIRDLGNAIDTTVSGLGSGLVHIETQDFSAVASQSINDVFSATYDHYRIVVQLLKATTSGYLQLRMRASGTDNTSSNYYSHVSYNEAAVSTYQGSTSNAANNMRMTVTFAATESQFGDFIFYNPFKSSLTAITGTQMLFSTTSAGGAMAGGHNVATSYDGFTLLQSAGVMTGTVSIFGLRKS